MLVTIVSIESRPTGFFHVDLERGGAFVIISSIFVLAYPQHLKFCLFIMITAVLGFELMQHFSDTRHARVSDALVKALGVLIGIVFGWFFNKQILHRLK